MVNKLLRKFAALSVVCLAAAALAGCGAIPVTPMPDALPNLTAERLGEIQGDERLTDAEKSQQIRDLAQIPADASGDRLVQFLLTLDTTP